MALSVVALATAVLITSVLPNYRPRLHVGERYGIDVSHHQGAIDWSAVAGDDVTFAYIKATESVDFVDDRFAANWAAARTEGIQTGAYHVFSLCAAGRDQATAFLEATPGEADLPPAVDLEFSSRCTVRPPATVVDAELAAFVSAVQDTTGQHVTMYIGQAFGAQYPLTMFDGQQRWVLSYLRRPHEPWAVWQVGGYANVEGIEGSVDLDVMAAPAVT
jgi:lysozyme